METQLWKATSFAVCDDPYWAVLHPFAERWSLHRARVIQDGSALRDLELIHTRTAPDASTMFAPAIADRPLAGLASRAAPLTTGGAGARVSGASLDVAL